MDRKVTLHYEVEDGDEGKGTMIGGDRGEVRVDQGYQREESGAGIGISKLRHPSYLGTLFVNSEDGFTDRVYESFTEDLPTYVNGIRFSKRWKYPGDGCYYDVVDARFRRIYRSIVQFVSYMHSQDVAFDNDQTLDIRHNFGVYQGELKFWRVKFISSSSLKSRQNDYRMISDVIESDVKSRLPLGLENDVPDLFDDLISTMRQYVDGDAAFLPKHVALLSDYERLAFIQNLKNRIPFVPSQLRWKYDDALVLLGNKSGWLDRLASLPFYPVLSNLHQQHFLTSQTRRIMISTQALVAHLRTIYTDGGGVLQNPSRAALVAINQSLINMCRNIATHVAERNYKVPLDSENVASMVLKMFGKDLVDFERILAHHGLLQYFTGDA